MINPGNEVTNLGRKESKIIYGFLFCFVFCPLVLGGLFYYYFCPDVHYVSLIDGVIKHGIHAPKHLVVNPVIVFIRNYIIDMLWAISMASTIALILIGNRKVYWLVFVPVIIGLVLELLQKKGLITGTFDVIDILFELMGAIIVYILIKFSKEKDDEKNK